MIDYSKIWRYANVRDAAKSMSINDTYYLVRSDDRYVSWIKNVMGRDLTLAERLRDLEDAERYETWAEAEAVAQALQAELGANYSADSLRYAAATVERIDDRLTVEDVVGRYQLYFVPAEKTEDGVDRIRSSEYGPHNTPGYIRECKPMIVRYFRLREEERNLYGSLTEEEEEAFYAYLRRLNAAKEQVREIEEDLSKKGCPPIGTMMED